MFYVLRSINEMLVKVTRKYQVTIPSEVRKKLGIKIGDLLAVKEEGGKIILVPVKGRNENSLEAMLGLFKEKIEVDAVALVEESWDED